MIALILAYLTGEGVSKLYRYQYKGRGGLNGQGFKNGQGCIYRILMGLFF
jgi:hypothetical protein